MSYFCSIRLTLERIVNLPVVNGSMPILGMKMEIPVVPNTATASFVIRLVKYIFGDLRPTVASGCMKAFQPLIGAHAHQWLRMRH